MMSDGNWLGLNILSFPSRMLIYRQKNILIILKSIIGYLGNNDWGRVLISALR